MTHSSMFPLLPFEINSKNLFIAGRGKAGRWLATKLKEIQLFDENHFIPGNLSDREAFLQKISFGKNTDAIIFLTVPDTNIIDTANYFKINFPDIDFCFVHLSGALASYVLPGLHVASFHPVLSLADAPNLIDKNIVVAAEGEPGLISWLDDLCTKINIELIEINAKDKPLYHAACVVAANLTAMLWNQSVKIFTELGFDDKTAQQLAYNLTVSSVHNVKELGYEKGLTGPIARGDLKTIDSNIKSLEVKHKVLASVYRNLRLLS